MAPRVQSEPDRTEPIAEHANASPDARARPWAFVPVLYFQQGLPYFVVDTVTTVYLKLREVAVDSIGHASSLVMLPWALKPLWSPLVDFTGTKRRWVLATQLALVCGMIALAFAVAAPDVLGWTIAACALIAFASATHDIAADGFYLLALERTEQAAFVGVRSTFYRLARFAGVGGLIALGAHWSASAGSVAGGWQRALVCTAAAYALFALWNLARLPRPAHDGPVRDATDREHAPPIASVLRAYFGQPRILAILAFIFCYRSGESMLTKMSASFLLAPPAEGGMGLTSEQLGFGAGTLGVAAIIAGGIAGGLVIARWGLRRCLWPMALAMHVPNLLYWWAAHAHPGVNTLYAVVGLEQLGYGFGFSAYMVFLMQISRRSRSATTHYAISTGLMALAASAAGWVSGDLVLALGYPGFFAVVCAAALPGLAVLPFVPLEDDAARREATA